MERKSPRAEQKKQRPLSLCSQENNIKREKGFGLSFLVLFWSISRGQACSYVWIGKKGITVQKKILFRFYSGCYWIKESTERITLGMEAVAARQEGPASSWAMLDSIGAGGLAWSLVPRLVNVAPLGAIHVTPFLDFDGNDNY